MKFHSGIITKDQNDGDPCLRIRFQLKPGNTSFGFLVPDNLSPDVLKNIDTITRQVQQKLLTNGQGLTINTI